MAAMRLKRIASRRHRCDHRRGAIIARADSAEMALCTAAGLVGERRGGRLADGLWRFVAARIIPVLLERSGLGAGSDCGPQRF